MDGMMIPRLKKTQIAHWSSDRLYRPQQSFAATEAYASLEVFMILKMIQCDLVHTSLESMDFILPNINPPPPVPALPPPPPEEDMEDGEVLSDDEAQAAREKILKEKERIKREKELAEKEKEEKEKAAKLAEEEAEQNAKLEEERKRRDFEEAQKRREEQDKGKKDVAVTTRSNPDVFQKKDGKFRNVSKYPPKKDSMLKQLVQEFHSQPTSLHQNSESENPGGSEEEKGPSAVFITVYGLEEEKPKRRSPSPNRRRYATSASGRVRPLMSVDSRGRRESACDPRDDPRDVRYRGSERDRNYSRDHPREPPSVREPYYARRERDYAASSASSTGSRRDHEKPSRFSSPEPRRRPNSPPKLRR